MYLTLFAKLFKHTPRDHHAWACLTTQCTAISHRHNHHSRNTQRHNHTTASKNRKLLVKGVPIPREWTKKDIVDIFEGNQEGVREVTEDDVYVINKKKYHQTCYIHGFHVGELERAMRVGAQHDLKLVPVLNTTTVPQHQKVMYVFAKAANLPQGVSEQDVFQLFKGWVHEENHVYPLYSDTDETQGQLLNECYTAMSFDMYTQAKSVLRDNHDIDLTLLTNTIHARTAMRDMERLCTDKHIILLRDMPEDMTLKNLSLFLDPLEPTVMNRFEDYWFVTFGKKEEATAAFENVDWMREFSADVQLKYENRMRKFRTDVPFRFNFWRHNARILNEL